MSTPGKTGNCPELFPHENELIHRKVQIVWKLSNDPSQLDGQQQFVSLRSLLMYFFFGVFGLTNT